MNEILEQKQSRREFLRGSARYLTLGGLIFTGGVLFARRKKSSKEERFHNLDICRTCPSLNTCNQVNG